MCNTTQHRVQYTTYCYEQVLCYASCLYDILKPGALSSILSLEIRHHGYTVQCSLLLSAESCFIYILMNTGFSLQCSTMIKIINNNINCSGMSPNKDVLDMENWWEPLPYFQVKSFSLLFLMTLECVVEAQNMVFHKCSYYSSSQS